ncbi:MAG: hypothetical protein R2742_12620 [Micropruina glycogenica]
MTKLVALLCVIVVVFAIPAVVGVGAVLLLVIVPAAVISGCGGVLARIGGQIRAAAGGAGAGSGVDAFSGQADRCGNGVRWP